jgi:hypothetical protein
MENALSKNENPLTKIGIIRSVKFKNTLGKFDNPLGYKKIHSVKMEYPLCKN